MPSSETLPKIAIFGLGAITVTIARALLKTNSPFTILCRNEERKMELKSAPIKFRFNHDQIEFLPLFELAETISETKQTFDYIILGAKNQDLQSSIYSASKLLKPEGKFILIQNGFPELNTDFSTKRILGGVVGWNTQKLMDGTYFQSNLGSFILGGMNGEIPPNFFKSLFGKFIPTILTDNLPGYRWHKIGINSVINGLSASCMLSLGELMLNHDGRNAAIKILTEVRQAMEKSGIKEEVVPGSISICKLGDGERALPVWIRHLILLVLGIKYFRVRTSMVQDLDHGRLTEIDALNGTIVRIAKGLNLDTKANQAVCDQVRDLEQHKIKPELTFLKKI